MNKPAIETLKEITRNILIAAIPGILTYLGTINETWAVILFFILRGLDKYLHQIDSENFITEFLRFG